jgi:hypothetical protein
VIHITAFFLLNAIKLILRMKKYVAFILIAFVSGSACKNRIKKNEIADVDKKNFFPVADYIQSEINYVDSLPLGIIKYTIHGNKADSVYIQSAEFNAIAKDFICADLNQNVFESEFSESSFIDQTTQAATFTYSTKNIKLELRRVDVIATVSEGSDKVSSIYLEKTTHKNDTLILKKLLWRTRKSFKIVTSKQFSNQSPVVEQLKVVWNPE